MQCKMCVAARPTSNLYMHSLLLVPLADEMHTQYALPSLYCITIYTTNVKCTVHVCTQWWARAVGDAWVLFT